MSTYHLNLIQVIQAGESKKLIPFGQYQFPALDQARSFLQGVRCRFHWLDDDIACVPAAMYKALKDRSPFFGPDDLLGTETVAQILDVDRIEERGIDSTLVLRLPR